MFFSDPRETSGWCGAWLAEGGGPESSYHKLSVGSFGSGKPTSTQVELNSLQAFYKACRLRYWESAVIVRANCRHRQLALQIHAGNVAGLVPEVHYRAGVCPACARTLHPFHNMYHAFRENDYFSSSSAASHGLSFTFVALGMCHSRGAVSCMCTQVASPTSQVMSRYRIVTKSRLQPAQKINNLLSVLELELK